MLNLGKYISPMDPIYVTQNDKKIYHNYIHPLGYRFKFVKWFNDLTIRDWDVNPTCEAMMIS